MIRPSDCEEKHLGSSGRPDRPCQPGSLWRRRRRYLIVGGLVVLVIVIALAVGLGVGITRSHKGQQCYYGHCPSDTAHPSPKPAPPAGQGTVIDGVWQPENGTTWQYQLAAPVTALTSTDSIGVWDIDLFDNEASIISDMQANGSKVVCYLSAGSYEDWRPDKHNFTHADKGNQLDGWPGEYWLNTSSANVRRIMAARFDLAVQKGCNGVDPDNVDAYNNDNGLSLTQQDATDYLGFLAQEAHARNLSIGLKNALEVLPDVIGHMQWSVNEQCLQHNECDQLIPFISQQKPVFHVEYPKGEADDKSAVSADIFNSICYSPSTDGFSSIIKNTNLDAFTEFCPITLL